ncbi:MAG: penicillin-binding protein 1C [Caulobacterales bacterium]|nr:penicillin-binding protein 1C [Caulobacterales bacterium]
MRGASAVRRLTQGLLAFMAAQTVACALDLAFPPDLHRAEQASPVVLDRHGAWLRALPVEGGRWRLRADLDRTDPTFLRRVVAVEDARFWIHPGVDPAALARALGSALAHGRPTSGASTLTMQTARLLEPRPRTPLSKAIEMLRAFQLEARFTKRQILGLYLTLAPYGGNLEGVRAASLSYFGHEPESLTDAEQALLIALPQSPEARRPDRRPQAARAARAQVLAKLARMGRLPRAAAQEAAADPLPARAAFPAHAWHAAEELALGASTGAATVVSTLDAPLQGRLESLAASTARAAGDGTTVAILVVEIDGRAVRGAVGSAGLGGQGGWIDMTRVRRSPGSALKPFIYAIAFEEGIAAPDTQIDDAPMRFADYQPQDFDRTFHGKVTAREALTQSLNVPAVATLANVGPEAFEARLAGAGVTLERPNAETRAPGLALALGGAGISLRDLAVLYAALGDGGIAKPLSWTEADAARARRAAGRRLVRADAAGQVLDILRETPPPAGASPAALMRSRPAMAFKTGTSYGFRDALSAGVVGGYVVVVWTGRPDGGARGGVTGRDSALPVLFDVADLLAAPAAAPRPIAPRAAPPALQRLNPEGEGPRLIFPPDGATVQVESFGTHSRGLSLAAGGDDLSWYVDGVRLPAEAVGDKVVWRPSGPGFYRVTVVDSSGRRAQSRVRIRAE